MQLPMPQLTNSFSQGSPHLARARSDGNALQESIRSRVKGAQHRTPPQQVAWQHAPRTHI